MRLLQISRMLTLLCVCCRIGYTADAPPPNGVVVSPINNVTSFVYCDKRYFWSESDGLFTVSYEQPVKKLLFRSLWGRVGTLCADSSIIYWSTDYGYIWKMDTHSDSVVVVDSGRGLITALYASRNEMVYAALPQGISMDNERNGNCVIVKFNRSRHCNDTLATGLPLITTLAVVQNKVLIATVQTTDKLQGVSESSSNSGTIIVSRYGVYSLSKRGGAPVLLCETDTEPYLIIAPDGSSSISVGKKLGSISTSTKMVKFSDYSMSVRAVDNQFYYGIDTTCNLLMMRRTDRSLTPFSAACQSPETFFVCPGAASIGVFCKKALTIIPR